MNWCSLPRKPVERQVVLGPIEIGARQVNTDGSFCAAGGRIDGEGTGVGKQIQKHFVLGGFANHLTRAAVIQEESGVDVISKVDQKLQSPFVNHFSLMCFGDLGVLRLASLSSAAFEIDVSLC